GFPEPAGASSPVASPGATRRLASFRIWTRAAPEPSDRLTFEMEVVSGSRPANDEGSMRLSMARSYGTSAAAVERSARMFMQMLVLGAGVMAAGIGFADSQVAVPKPIKAVVLAD